MTTDLYRIAADLAAGELVELTAEQRPIVPPGCLIDEFGFVLTHVGRGRTRVTMRVREIHLNQRGVVQAGAIVALADAGAGWAAYSALDDGGFTTLELRCSLLRAANLGDTIVAETVPVHLGRRTLVFDVGIHRGDTNRPVARFGCTQLVVDRSDDSAPSTARDSR